MQSRIARIFVIIFLGKYITTWLWGVAYYERKILYWLYSNKEQQAFVKTQLKDFLTLNKKYKKAQEQLSQDIAALSDWILSFGLNLFSISFE